MKKIILLITASLMFLTAEDVKIKSAGTDADDGVVFKNSIDSTLVDIDGTGVVNIKGIPAAGATLRLFEAFGNGSNYLQLNPGVSLAENATWHLSSAGGSGNMFLGFESGSAVLSSGAANIGLGYNAAKALTSGVRNVALGYKALTAGTSANYNITIGYQAGDVLTTGQKNIIIGSDADPSAASGENQVVIGYEAVGTADNQVVLGNSSTTQWVPGSADVTDLGSTAKEFNNVYLGDGAVINLGVDQDVSLTHIADTGVRMNGTSQLQFRDGNLKVSSSADGQLDIDADNELELVAPMVDINASTEVNISGELKIGGKVTTGSEGAGVDVVFYSNTSGDDFTWDASEEKLVITGSNGQDALHILDGDLRVVDKIYGDGSGLTGLTVSSVAGDFTVAGEENNSGTLNLYADDGDDDNDKWRVQVANGGSMTVDSKQSDSWSTLLTLGNTGNAALAGDLTVAGEVTASKVGLAALDIDGATDIGAAIVDADLFIIDDGAGGTNRKVTASRIKTFAQSGVSSAADDITTGDAAVTIATSSGAVNITPAAGSAIVLDGTINVERGVVSGATSVTSVMLAASTSLQTPLLEYIDGDDAITIADGGGITVAQDATFSGSVETATIDYTDGDLAMTIADGGAVTTSGNLSVGGSNNELRFYEGSNYVGFEAPALSADKIWVLPTADGSSGQALITNGSGTLSWDTGSTVNDLDDLSDGLVENSSLWLGNDPSGSTNSAGNNIGIGTTTLDAITTGDNNIAVGYDALTANTTGEKNIAIGSGALDGPDTESNNLAIGYEAMSASIAGGEYNVAVGNSSLKALTSGDKNTGVGYNALTGVTSGSWNTAVGHEAGKAMTTGADNTAFGLSAGAAITTGARNIAIGGVALDNVDTENDNLAIGYAALGGAIAGGEYNVAIGNYSLDAITSGDDNIALGYKAMTDLTYGSYNIAIGFEAMENATTPGANVAIGHQSLYGATDGTEMTGGYNTAVGYQSLYTNTSGSWNSAFGHSALKLNTTGYDNTSIGEYSMFNNTTGEHNVAVGTYALYRNTTAGRNTGVGYYAGGNETTGEHNVSVGYYAGRGYSTSYANDNNTAIGSFAMENLRTGGNNAALGYEAGEEITTGGNNTSLGYQAGDAITTGSNNVIIGSGSNANSSSASNRIAIGYGATGHGNNITVIGNTDMTAWHPADDNGVDLGSSSYEFKDLYVDGTANLDAVSLGGSITPASDDTYSLGSSSYQFDNLYVDGVANLDAVRTGLIEYNDGDDAITISDGGDMDFNANAIEDFTASIPSEITGATTLAASHNGQVLICNSGSDFSLTIPEDTLPKGFNCLIVQKGAGEITLAAASGNVTINNRNSHTKTANQWAIMTLICIDATTDANVFVSSGDGTS